MIVTDNLRVNYKMKTDTFFMYVYQVYLIKNKQTRKQKAYIITVVQIK